MRLQEASSPIWRFISHRKAHSHGGNSTYPHHQRYIDGNKPTPTPGRLSWLLQHSSEVSSHQRCDSAAIEKSLPLLPAHENAYLSASSLRSCDSCINPCLIKDPLSEAVLEPNPPGGHYPSPLSPSITSETETRRFMLEEPLSPRHAPIEFRTKTPSLDLEMTLSSLNMLQPLTTEHADNDSAPTQSTMITKDPGMQDLSEELGQLIRETDEAFMAVGTALANAKAATQGWYDTPEAAAVKRTPSISRSPTKKIARNKSLGKTSPKKSVLSSKPSRRKSVKKRRPNLLSRALKNIPPPPVKPSQRWTLTDVTTNMVDAFSGKMFKMEVDEMLSPGKMQELREGFGNQNERRTSIDSVRSTKSLDNSTPTQLFHLESPSSRIDATKFGSPPFPSPVLPPPAIPHRKPVPPPIGKTAATPKVDPAEDPATTKHSPQDRGVLLGNLQFPTSFRGHFKNNSNPNFLPTIPEFSPLSLSPAPTSRKRSSQSRKKSHRPDPQYIAIPSTPFTLTSARFRHGPIRFEREQLIDISYNRALSASKEKEDQLDWTAFQMAILGTIDENWSAENEREQDEKERDEILRWWDGFGFDGWGAMVTARKSARRRKTKKRIRRDSRDFGRKNGQENGRGQSHSSVSSSSSSDGTCYSPMMEGLEADTRSPTIHSQGATYIPESSASRDSSQSPTPNFNNTNDQRVEASSPIEIMPMGFNLERDLGDFLSWEVNHVWQAHWRD